MSRPETATGWRSIGRANWSERPRTLTYSQLKDAVCQAANILSDLGLVAGDRVAIYMPMVPEAIVAMLACARLGVMHSVVFAGFSATALRLASKTPKPSLEVITTDGQYRRGKAVALKDAVDETVADQPTVNNVLVVRRTGIDVDWTEGRDLWDGRPWKRPPHHVPEASIPNSCCFCCTPRDHR